MSRRVAAVETIHPGTVSAIRPDACSDSFRALCSAAKVSTIRLHAIRHTIATALHGAGEVPVAVAMMLGHEVTTHLALHVKATDGSAIGRVQVRRDPLRRVCHRVIARYSAVSH